MSLFRLFLPVRLKTRKALAISAALLALVVASLIGFVSLASAHQTNSSAVNNPHFFFLFRLRGVRPDAATAETGYNVLVILYLAFCTGRSAG